MANEESISKIVHESLGEASSIFMSNPKPGTKQEMPVKELELIAEKEIAKIKEIIALEIAEDRIANERHWARKLQDDVSTLKEELVVKARDKRINRKRRINW